MYLAAWIVFGWKLRASLRKIVPSTRRTDSKELYRVTRKKGRHWTVRLTVKELGDVSLGGLVRETPQPDHMLPSVGVGTGPETSWAIRFGYSLNSSLH